MHFLCITFRQCPVLGMSRSLERQNLCRPLYGNILSACLKMAGGGRRGEGWIIYRGPLERGVATLWGEEHCKEESTLTVAMGQMFLGQGHTPDALRVRFSWFSDSCWFAINSLQVRDRGWSRVCGLSQNEMSHTAVIFQINLIVGFCYCCSVRPEKTPLVQSLQIWNHSTLTLLTWFSEFRQLPHLDEEGSHSPDRDDVIVAVGYWFLQRKVHPSAPRLLDKV